MAYRSFANIPYVGNLFGNTDNQDTRTGLIVLLTPHVIRNPTEDAQSITDELRDEIKAVDPIKPRKKKKSP